MSLNNDLCKNFNLDGSKCKYPPGLYLVGTPIGNLEDITFRALYTLQKVDMIACEDTRVTKKLLSHFGIHNQLVTYNDARGDASGQVTQALTTGKRVALVSDAGMPLVSDPGYKLVEFAHANGIYVTCIPGPSAVLTALTLSGLPSHEFTFKGFFPKKEKETEHLLASLRPDHTYIFFESPNRMPITLDRIIAHIDVTSLSIARELTKSFEEIITGRPEDVKERLHNTVLKGECVLLLRTAPQDDSLELLAPEIRDRLKTESVKSIVKDLSEKTSLSKNDIYDYVLRLKEEKTDA